MSHAISGNQPEVIRLIAEVQDLTAVVRQLVATTPSRTKTWLDPRELAGLLGVSTRTIGNWREQGRFRPGSFRLHNKKFQYHGETALVDAELVCGTRSTKPLLPVVIS